MTPAPLVIGTRHYERYTVCAAFGCRIVHGSIPASEIGHLVSGFGQNARHDIQVAQVLEATMVIGEKTHLAELRRALGLEDSA